MSVLKILKNRLYDFFRLTGRADEPVKSPPIDNREIIKDRQIESLCEQLAGLAELRRADIEAMEAAQAILLTYGGSVTSGAFSALERRTGWMARTRQAVACGGPLEGE